MKFGDGIWLTRPGITQHRAACLRDYEIGDDSVTLYLPCNPASHRGATLRGPLLTMTLSSPMEDIITVRIVHFDGAAPARPSFRLGRGTAPLQITEDDEKITLLTGNSSAVIQKAGNPDIQFQYRGQPRTGFQGLGALAYISEGEYMAAQQDLVNDLQLPQVAAKKAYLRQNLNLGVGESIYGLGERFTPFVRNGQTVDIWQADGGTGSEYSYKNVPFYVSNRGYGILVDHPEKVSFEIGSTNTSKIEISLPGERLGYHFIGGDDLKAVLGRYTDFTGKAALPPAWSFGLWLSTSFTTEYDEKTVSHFIDGMIERDIPLSVFHYDCFWMKEYQWCDFEWDSRYFPDPAGMLQRLKAKDLRICVWINPYIGQKSPLFQEAKDAGHLLGTREGDVWQWDHWQPGMALVDFTSPDACAWFAGKLARLVDMGVDCFKTDFGERIPVDVAYADGSDPYRMHNFYTYLYNETVFAMLEQKKGAGQACVFARSGTVGSQKFPVHWGGDSSATYESMAETLRGGLSFGLSGFAFWSHDIGGFEATATADLYKRWVAFGLLSSHSRLHGSSSYRVPWNFDDEACDVLRFFAKLKCRLMPYLMQKSVEGCANGLPVLRAMVLEFPGDPTCAWLDQQYMLGDSLLVAPVFNEDSVARFYVPAGEGEWTDLLTGRSYMGGSWYTESADYFHLPLLLRPGHVLPVGAVSQRPEYDYAQGVCLVIGAHPVQAYDTQVSVPGLTGQADVQFRLTGCLSQGLSVTAAAAGDKAIKPWSVRLAGEESCIGTEGVQLQSLPFSPSRPDSLLEINLP